MLKNISIDYKKAAVSVRGILVLNSAEKSLLYLQLREFFGIQEALILSTCNRTEIFFVDKSDRGEQLIALLVSSKGLKTADFRPFFNTFIEEYQATDRLFRIAMGLESHVLGDREIFNQVKQAYQESTDAGMSGAFLHRCLHTLFSTHKRVCQETEFKSGAASTSYNAIKLLKLDESIHLHSRILVVGAGKIGHETAKNLVDSGFSNIAITNRTQSKALAISQDLKIDLLDFSERFHLDAFDALIGAAGADKPLFDDCELNSKKKPVIVDLCSPPSFSSEFVGSFASRYYNIDCIGSLTEETLQTRIAEAPKVESIIRESLSELNSWIDEYGITSEIRKFKTLLEELRRETLAEYLKKTSETQHEIVEQITESIIQKIVKIPVLQLKQSCQRHDPSQLSQTLNILFNLEHQNSKLKAKQS